MAHLHNTPHPTHLLLHLDLIHLVQVVVIVVLR
jgi:hypothetical protein